MFVVSIIDSFWWVWGVVGSKEGEWVGVGFVGERVY